MASRLLFTVSLDDLTDVEASDVFVLRPAISRGGQLGAGGELAHVQLFNPANSGIITIVDLALLESSTTDLISIRTTTEAIGSLGAQEGFRDRRLSGGPATQVRQLSDVAAQGSQVGTIRIPTAESVQVPLDFILAPGTGINLINTTVALTLAVTWYFTEEDA